MDSQVFREQMERLMSCFGARHYNTDRCMLLWRECSGLSNEWMIRTVDHFIGNERQAPLMNEFRAQISLAREQSWKKQKTEGSWKLPENVIRYLCTDCMNSGRVDQDIDGKPGYVFRCHCEHGANRPENWPRILRGSLKSVGRK